MSILNYCLAFLFFVSALLQLNDPDPLKWVLIYLVAAFFCFQAAKDYFYPKLYLLFTILLLVYAFFLFKGENGVLSWIRDHNAESIAGSMKASAPWIEETREFFGLAIVLGSLALNFILMKRMN